MKLRCDTYTSYPCSILLNGYVPVTSEQSHSPWRSTHGLVKPGLATFFEPFTHYIFSYTPMLPTLDYLKCPQAGHAVSHLQAFASSVPSVWNTLYFCAKELAVPCPGPQYNFVYLACNLTHSVWVYD